MIVGRSEIVDRLRKHSLYRALRVDKLCLAALEATLAAHRRESIKDIPALRMLAISYNTLENRARNLVDQLSKWGTATDLEATILAGQSAIGGGAGPTVHPPTALLGLKHRTLSTDEVELKLRHFSPPVIARIADGLVLIDLRTVDASEEPDLLRALTSLEYPDNSVSVAKPSFQ